MRIQSQKTLRHEYDEVFSFLEEISSSKIGTRIEKVPDFVSKIKTHGMMVQRLKIKLKEGKK